MVTTIQDPTNGLADKSMFVQFLTEGATPSTPTSKTNLDSWIGTLKVPFTCARDAEGSAPFTIRSTYGVKETSYILDRASRKILFKSGSILTGFDKLKTMP